MSSTFIWFIISALLRIIIIFCNYCYYLSIKSCPKKASVILDKTLSITMDNGHTYCLSCNAWYICLLICEIVSILYVHQGALETSWCPRSPDLMGQDLLQHTVLWKFGKTSKYSWNNYFYYNPWHWHTVCPRSSSYTFYIVSY